LGYGQSPYLLKLGFFHQTISVQKRKDLSDMKLTFLNFLLLSLAAFRLTRLIVYDKITEFLRDPFFDEIEETNEAGEIEIYYIPKKTGLRHFFGELLSCYWCTGIWAATGLVGVYFLLPGGVAVPVILILAVAGLASILETIVQFFLEK
jgi:hypothetical protein